MKSSQQRRDPGPTVFGWDEEPAQERPSEWGPSTQFDVASGYYRGGSAPASRAMAQRSGRGWVVTVLFLALLGGGVWAALRWGVPLLHR
jgi:hypothetical protein